MRGEWIPSDYLLLLLAAALSLMWGLFMAL
jgi:hypothetical protein